VHSEEVEDDGVALLELEPLDVVRLPIPGGVARSFLRATRPARQRWGAITSTSVR
jgi:hypothetical protein